MDNKTTRNWTTEETNICSILADPITKFMLTLERKASKKASKKEVFEAILKELTLLSWKHHAKREMKSRWKAKQLWRKLEDKKKKTCSGLTGTQDPTRFQILNPMLSHTNEWMDGICWNPADTSLSDFFRQEEDNKEVRTFLTICYYHVTYAFQSQSTLYSCLNAKELLARNRREIWSVTYELSGCGFESRCSHLELFSWVHLINRSHTYLIIWNWLLVM